nr:hypothetical protein CFP56_55470 [Quercus suber]
MNEQLPIMNAKPAPVTKIKSPSALYRKFHGDHLKNQNIPHTSPTYITIQPCSPIITTFLNDIMSDVSFDFNQTTYRDN